MQSDPYAQYRELTLRGTILGAIITVIFTASNLYLGLKVGLTVASSIPAAVISMAILKFFSDSNILENNMVQTQASAAGTLSSVIFVLPAMLIIGYWQNFPFWQTVIICSMGGILGVIFSIPLRRVMVVNSKLPYPEGIAAAEILKAGNGNRGMKEIATGGLLAGLSAIATQGLRIISENAGFWFKSGAAVFQIPMGFSLALLGAGYLIGIIGGIAIFIGIALTWGVIVPYFTATSAQAPDMDMISFAMQMWKNKVRFMGTGVIGIASIWTLITLTKPMIEGLRQSAQTFKNTQNANHHIERTEIDLSPKLMIYIMLFATLAIAAAFAYFMHPAMLSLGTTVVFTFVCTLLSVCIGFLIAATCGYMAGLVGSSYSPISGICILSVILNSLILLALGKLFGLTAQTQGVQFLTALTLFSSSIVAAIASISNDNMQDLKTGFLVKATPWRQQIALLIGCVVGALVVAPVLEMLYNAYGFAGAMPRANMNTANALSAPQATLMSTISQGIFNGKLEWSYILMGAGLGIGIIIIDFILKKISNNRFHLPALAVGMGIYLPPSINMPIIFGALMTYFISRHLRKYAKRHNLDNVQLQKDAENQASLFAAGLIVGESLIGVLLAFVITLSLAAGGSDSPLALNLPNWKNTSEWLGLVVFLLTIVIFTYRILKVKRFSSK